MEFKIRVSSLYGMPFKSVSGFEDSVGGDLMVEIFGLRARAVDAVQFG